MDYNPDDVLIFDTETRGLRPELGETAFACATARLSRFRRVTVYRLDREDDRRCLVEELASAPCLLGHHVVFDCRQLIRTLDLPLDFFAQKRLLDTRVRASYAWPGRYFIKSQRKDWRPFSLKTLTADAVDVPGDERSLKAYLLDRCKRLYGKSKPKWTAAQKAEEHDYSLVPDEILTPYLIGDILRTGLLMERTDFVLASLPPHVQASVRADEALLHPILQMEVRGLPGSRAELQIQIDAAKSHIVGLKEQLGWDCNKKAEMESHLGDLAERFRFFTKKPDRKTGRRVHSFSEEALKRFVREGDRDAESILKVRHFEKRVNAYGKAWAPWLDRVGRLHCYLNVEGTHTGRWSCNGPNLQTMPKESGGLRRVIVPEPGHVIVCADWSAMEYLAAAHVADDPVLLKACLESDVHEATAALVYGSLSTDKIRAKKQRQSGKTFNYAQLYGAGLDKLRSQLEKDTGEAWSLTRISKAVDVLSGAYAKLNAWRIATLRQAEKGVAQTDPFGRVYRPVYNREYAIINWIIQGFCAGAMKRAVQRVYELGLDLRMVVHDELLVMARFDDVDRVAALVQQVMSNIDGFVFPVDVNVAWDNYDGKRAWIEPSTAG